MVRILVATSGIIALMFMLMLSCGILIKLEHGEPIPFIQDDREVKGVSSMPYLMHDWYCERNKDHKEIELYC